jgi:hypothetical protein
VNTAAQIQEGMSMRTSLISICAFLFLSSSVVLAGSWTLPRAATVKDDGPRTYRFTVEYSTSDTRGQVIRRQLISGNYTRGLPGGDSVWTGVSQIDSDGPGEPSGPVQKREFMEGFRYHTASASLAPDFFKGFPPTAVFERNLIWDTEMFELYGQHQFRHLQLNQPYHFVSGQTMNMPGVGAFQNRDVQLTWMGRSERNGRDCALIGYSAYFNPLEIANGAMKLKGRSHYWGQIWVALATRQIEYATLYEDVLGEMSLAGQDTPQVVSVFRSGIFEPIVTR